MLFKGAGYLAGFILGSAAAIVFVAITGVEALIGAVAASISIPAGIGFEKLFNRGNPADCSTRKLLLAFSFFGIAVLALVIGLTI